MRWQAILAAGIAAAAGATGAAYAQAKPEAGATLQQAALTEERAAADALRLTSPPNAAADRTYDDPEAALLQADIDYLVREGRRRLP